MKKQRVSNRLYLNVFLGLAVALVILYGINIVATGKIINPVKASSESNKPANLHLTLITNDCDNCYDIANLVSFIKKQNVKVIQEKNLQYTENEAQNLISENNIKSLPALIITGEVSQQNLASLWEGLGVQPASNAVVVSGVAPYYDLAREKVVGLVQVIRLTDNSCAECYDVENHMQILPNFGVYVDKSLTYDISSNSSKDLVKKYNITKVPTIILSPDASVYAALNNVWDQVGTVENDGWYVFRDTGQMGTYKDLALNKIINATG